MGIGGAVRAHTRDLSHVAELDVGAAELVAQGLVERVRDYPWSSFHRYVEQGVYSTDWGRENPCPGYNEPEWE